MITNTMGSVGNGTSAFRIKRPLITTNGFVSDVDETAKALLEELNALLNRSVFDPGTFPAGPSSDDMAVVIVEGFDEVSKDIEALNETLTEAIEGPKRTGRGRQAASFAAQTGSQAGSGRQFTGGGGAVLPIPSLLALPLTPKQIPANVWADGSLLQTLQEYPESADKMSLSDYVETTPDLSTLKYAFENNLSLSWFNLDFNTKAVLDDYPAIRDYLIAWTYHVMGARDVNGVKSFIFSNKGGAKNVANYAIISAARTLIDSDKLEVPNFNRDNSGIVTTLLTATLSLSAASFNTTATSVIRNFVLNARESNLIDIANIGTIPPDIKPLLIQYIRQSPVPITSANVNFFMPLFISQIKGTTPVSDPTEVDLDQSDKDFTVDYFQDDTAMVQISKSAVLCAAQLYYDMVLGDELNVFEIANYFTHKYLVRGGIELQDSQLREDLQMYVFSNRFTDLKSGKIIDRTRPAERKMFYRQVFGSGAAQVTDDMIVNTEFSRLWKVLILESAKYLERAQASFNPDSYVSRQNVMQAVEDLQYNLSTHCTGMANVITPMIYAELNFVIKRIFMHPEILRQVVPSGGTWWRVVETLYLDMKNARPKATVIYNKAKLGHEIIGSIAGYNPVTFEDDANFSAFISSVDALITTQSILQDALVDDLKKDQEDPAAQNGAYPMKPAPQADGDAPAAKKGQDEWDF